MAGTDGRVTTRRIKTDDVTAAVQAALTEANDRRVLAVNSVRPTLRLVSGLVASQCAKPVLAAILIYAMAEGAIAYDALLLVIYALGCGVPIVIVGTFAGALKGFLAFGRWTSVLEKVSGVIIIGVGLYLVWLA